RGEVEPRDRRNRSRRAHERPWALRPRRHGPGPRWSGLEKPEEVWMRIVADQRHVDGVRISERRRRLLPHRKDEAANRKDVLVVVDSVAVVVHAVDRQHVPEGVAVDGHPVIAEVVAAPNTLVRPDGHAGVEASGERSSGVADKRSDLALDQAGEGVAAVAASEEPTPGSRRAKHEGLGGRG